MVYLILVAVVVLGIMTLLYAQACGAEQQRDDWKAVADDLAGPLRNAPIGLSAAGGAWEDAAARALAAYNAMLEPEG